MATKRTRTFKMNGDGSGGDEITLEGGAAETGDEAVADGAAAEDGTVVDGAGVDDGTDDLAAQLADARKQIEEANRRLENEAAERRRLEEESKRGNAELQDSRMLVIDNAIQAATSNKEQVRARIVAAKEAGDYAAEAAAIDELSQINIKLRSLELGKGDLEQRIENAKSAPQQDPVDGYIATLDPASQSWLRSHRDLVEPNGRPTQDLIDAHNYAVYKRTAPGTPSYFKMIEEHLGGGADHGAEIEAQREEPASPPRRQAPPAAPVRGTGAQRSTIDGVEDLGGGKYRLSPELAATARELNLTPQEYLKGLLDLRKEGAFTRH